LALAVARQLPKRLVRLKHERQRRPLDVID
jgi:hypothetical protein